MPFRHPFFVRRQRPFMELSATATVGLALLLASAVYFLRLLDARVADVPLLLFVVPIALCAVRFGLRGGLLSAGLGFALTSLGYLTGGIAIGVIGYASQATVLFVVGGVVGHFADQLRTLERHLRRHEELSLDLFCIADFDGHFTRLNPAWERTLGYTREELLAQPFLDFVHPDEPVATLAEADRQTKEGQEVLHFANRCRHGTAPIAGSRPTLPQAG
jgi:PAS domain-containing protein